MWLETKKAIVVLVGALLNALALNLFLIPANVYSSGFTGVAQLVSSIVTDYTPFTISTGVLLLLLNIPVTILGWKKWEVIYCLQFYQRCCNNFVSWNYSYSSTF